ncbi:MAG TPA: hypothetical protein VGO42_16845 [Reyranella sp.]|jgi:hypothetical protein|nr:hypothetical protein [Reyranella sp.]
MSNVVSTAFRSFGLLAAVSLSLSLSVGGPAWAEQRDASPLQSLMTEPPIMLAQGACKNAQAYNACLAPKLISCSSGTSSQVQRDQCTNAAKDECSPACNAP